MGKQKDVKLGFTTIMHEPRLKYELSQNDYCIADVIYHLSHNPRGSIIGWCYASRQSIGNFFGISRPTVIKSIKKLKAKGLIEVHNETDHLQATTLWYDNFVMFKLKSHDK